MKKQSKLKLVKKKIKDNLYTYESYRVEDQCDHLYDEDKTLKNSLGIWKTCEKCRSTKIFYR